MSRESLVALNLVDNNILINPSLTPILYYWDGNSELIDTMMEDTKLTDLVVSKITFQNYTKLRLSYFLFEYIENEEVYSDNTISIQDIFTLDKFESSEIIMQYLLSRFIELYKNSFKTEYTVPIISIEDSIIEIYRAIKQKFKTRISKLTMVNWVRSTLISDEKLNQKNSDIIINKLNEILINENDENI